MTDAEVLTQIQYAVVEPSPDGGILWQLGDFTAATVINFLNQRQNKFLHETGVVISRTTINTPPNVERFELPNTLLRINRVSWETTNGIIRELPRSDTWTLDHGYPDWPYSTAARPNLYTEYDVPQREIQVTPASYDNGVINLLYVALGTTLSNSGIEFTVPDFCVPPIKWGVLADMLGESSRTQDQERAQYCEARYQQGVEAALILINSWG